MEPLTALNQHFTTLTSPNDSSKQFRIYSSHLPAWYSITDHDTELSTPPLPFPLRPNCNDSTTYPRQSDGDDGKPKLDSQGVVLVQVAAVPGGGAHHPDEDSGEQSLGQRRGAGANLGVGLGHAEVGLRAVGRGYHLEHGHYTLANPDARIREKTVLLAKIMMPHRSYFKNSWSCFCFCYLPHIFEM